MYDCTVLTSFVAIGVYLKHHISSTTTRTAVHERILLTLQLSMEADTLDTIFQVLVIDVYAIAQVLCCFTTKYPVAVLHVARVVSLVKGVQGSGVINMSSRVDNNSVKPL